VINSDKKVVHEAHHTNNMHNFSVSMLECGISGFKLPTCTTLH